MPVISRQLLFVLFCQNVVASQGNVSFSDANTDQHTEYENNDRVKENLLTNKGIEIVLVNETNNETEANNTDRSSAAVTISTTDSSFINNHHSILGKSKAKMLCECDLTFGSCDINCCCDHECSSEDRLAFSQCADQQSFSTSRSCIQKQLMYKKNAFYKASTVNSMFCIVGDNFIQKYNYNTLQEMTNANGFKFEETMSNPYSWDQKYKVKLPLIKTMKAGSNLYMVQLQERSQLTAWSLPASLYSDNCQAKDNVVYLENQRKACNLRINENSLPCSHFSLRASAYYGFYLLKSVALINDTIHSNFCKELSICIQVVPSECYIYLGLDRNKRICSDELPIPYFDPISRKCHNIVKSVTYRIEHNGTLGLVNATAFFELGTVNANATFVNQQFSTTYSWISATNESHTRSGNPGYIVGYPILAGNKIMKNETDEDALVMEINKNSRNWLTVLRSHHSGQCTEIPENRAPVNFGENIMSGCLLQSVPKRIKSCSDLQKLILSLLNGTRQPDHVGSFGNSDSQNISEWIPLYFENTPNDVQPSDLMCTSTVTSLNIDIYHAATGTFASPQHKIIGAVFRYGNHMDINLHCGETTSYPCEQKINVVITTSVTFKDVSQPAVQIFGRPPAIHASVPADFFYPFTLSSQAPYVTTAPVSCLCILIYTTFINKLI